jgi:serine protease
MNHFGGYNANATYFVFTPHGRSMLGFGTSWCAWHDEPTSGTDMAYAYMPYMPDAGTSCGRNFVNRSNNSYGNGYFDGFSIVGGHEYAEAMTDPHPERTSTNFGWITSTGSSGEENGDLCAWASNSTNITLGSHFYAVQPLWSNASSSCVTSY